MRNTTNNTKRFGLTFAATLLAGAGLALAQGAGPDWRGRYGTTCAAWEIAPSGLELVVWDSWGSNVYNDMSPQAYRDFACAGWLYSFEVPMVATSGTDALFALEMTWSGGGTGPDTVLPLAVMAEVEHDGVFSLTTPVGEPEIKLWKSVDGGGVGLWTFSTLGSVDVVRVSTFMPFGLTPQLVTLDSGFMSVPVPGPATGTLMLAGAGLILSARRRTAA